METATKNLVQEIKETAKIALVSKMASKGKSGDFNKLGFLILQAFLKGDRVEIKEISALFVKDAIYHELRQILSNVTPIAAQLETNEVFSYVKNKAGDKVTVTKEQVLNSESDEIITISTAYKFLKSGSSNSVSDKTAFKAWQENICTSSIIAMMDMKDLTKTVIDEDGIESAPIMTEEELDQCIAEGKAFLENVLETKKSIKTATEIITDVEGLFNRHPQAAIDIASYIYKFTHKVDSIDEATINAITAAAKLVTVEGVCKVEAA